MPDGGGSVLEGVVPALGLQVGERAELRSVKQVGPVHIQGDPGDLRVLYIDVFEQDIIVVVQHLEFFDDAQILHRGDVDNRFGQSKVGHKILIELDLVVQGVVGCVDGGGERIPLLVQQKAVRLAVAEDTQRDQRNDAGQNAGQYQFVSVFQVQINVESTVWQAFHRDSSCRYFSGDLPKYSRKLWQKYE